MVLECEKVEEGLTIGYKGSLLLTRGSPTHIADLHFPSSLGPVRKKQSRSKVV
jgi:hypothetical protein